MKTREGGNKACDPVRSQPQVPGVELRRMGEAMEEVIGGVWFHDLGCRTLSITLIAMCAQQVLSPSDSEHAFG